VHDTGCGRATLGSVPIFSDPTTANIVELAIESNVSKNDLTLLLRKADLARFAPPAPGLSVSRADMLLAAIDAANRAGGAGDTKAQQALTDFVFKLVERVQGYPFLGEQLEALADSLRADGFELTLRNGPLQALTLRPTEPSVAPLPPAINALEAELDRRGYDIALNHYRQVTNALVAGTYEAANVALRSSLEELVTRIATDHDGFQPELGPNGQPKANQGGRAIGHMVDRTKNIPEDDGGMMLRGLWRMTCTNGSHPGRSSAEEARSRLQLVTATARILLTYFPA
jgi:hypothetical protein